MNKREYYLVLPAKLGPEYGGGWAAGSVLAHWLHLSKGYSGVFWVWALTPSGILNEDKPYFERLIDPLGKPRIVDGSQVQISPKGFFYESRTHSITWEFEADFIIRDAETSNAASERLRRFESCIPLFRKEYLTPRPWGSWILIKSLKQLREPVKGIRGGNLYYFPSFKYFSSRKRRLVDLSSSHLACGNAFVLECPQDIQKKEPDPETQVSGYLKQFLYDNPPKGRLRESNIHDAFALQLLRSGYFFLHEKPLKRGRYDFLLKKDGELIAIEIKLRGGDAAVDQLLDYIEELRKRFKKDKIRGVIVCGQPDEDLVRTAKERDLTVLNYEISIQVPLL